MARADGTIPVDIRLIEAEQAATVLGVSVRVKSQSTDRRLFDTFRIGSLATVFRKSIGRRSSSSFGGKTVLASPDHYQAMPDADAAVFIARLTKWDEHFGGLPYIRSRTSLVSRSHATCGYRAGYVVADIGSTLAVKLDAVQQYATQFPATKSGDFWRTIETMNRYHGITAGYEAGELFLESLGGCGRPDAAGQAPHAVDPRIVAGGGSDLG